MLKLELVIICIKVYITSMIDCNGITITHDDLLGAMVVLHSGQTLCLRQYGGWHYCQRSIELTVDFGGVQYNQHALEDDCWCMSARQEQYDLYHHSVGSRVCCWETVVDCCAEVAECYAKTNYNFVDAAHLIID